MALPRTKLLEEERKVLETFTQDAHWFEDHWKELRKKYGGDFLAVKEKRVIAHDASLEKLINKLKASGEKPANLFIESTYRPKGDIILTLPQQHWQRELLLDIRRQGESELEEMVTGSPGKWEYTPAAKKYFLEGKPLLTRPKRH